MKFGCFHTFASRGDRSGRAYAAESAGLENSHDAARRLRVVPHQVMELLSSVDDECADEEHHVRCRTPTGTRVLLLDYREPQAWDRIAADVATMRAALVHCHHLSPAEQRWLERATRCKR